MSEPGDTSQARCQLRDWLARRVTGEERTVGDVRAEGGRRTDGKLKTARLRGSAGPRKTAERQKNWGSEGGKRGKRGRGRRELACRVDEVEASFMLREPRCDPWLRREPRTPSAFKTKNQHPHPAGHCMLGRPRRCFELSLVPGWIRWLRGAASGTNDLAASCPPCSPPAAARSQARLAQPPGSPPPQPPRRC
eukprot:3250132-Rhodomonas_salina.3